MIFSNVLFIVYGMSCARGQTYDLEIISGVYNHVRFSKVITQPGYSLELALLHCADEPQTAKQLSTVAFKLSVWSQSCHCCVTFSTQLSALAFYSVYCLFLADQIFYRSCVYQQHFRSRFLAFSYCFHFWTVDLS